MHRQLTQEELTEQANKEKLLTAGQAKAATHAVDLFNLGGIFLVKGLTLLEPFFEAGLKFVMLPLAALSLGAMTGITWYEAYKQKFAAYPVFKAVVETVKFLAITTAVIGALALPVYFAVAGPAIFAATFAAMTILNIATALYNGVMAAKTKISDPVKSAEYRERAIDSAKGAVVGTIATAAITAVMIFKMPILTVMGVIAGVMGGVFAVVKFNDLYHKKAMLKAHAEAFAQDENTRTNNADLAKRFGLNREDYEPLPTEDHNEEFVSFNGKTTTSAPTLFQPAPQRMGDETDLQNELIKPQHSLSNPQ